MLASEGAYDVVCAEWTEVGCPDAASFDAGETLFLAVSAPATCSTRTGDDEACTAGFLGSWQGVDEEVDMFSETGVELVFVGDMELSFLTGEATAEAV